MNSSVSNLRHMFLGVRTIRILTPKCTLSSASRDYSLIRCSRDPVVPPGSLSSRGRYRTQGNIFSPRTICLLAKTNPWTWPTHPPHQSSCNLFTLKYPSVILGRRNKTTKQKSGKRSGYTKDKADAKRIDQEQFTDEEDSDDDDLESGSDFRDVRVKVPSLRMDAVLKAGLNMSRNKVETAFYASKIRVNGEKILKKSKQVYEGDELDVVKGVSSVNPDFMNISRIVILRVGNYNEDSDKFEMKLRCTATNKSGVAPPDRAQRDHALLALKGGSRSNNQDIVRMVRM